VNPAGSLVLRLGVRALQHTVLVFSLYLLFAGHNAPGGGFVGGLVAGCALVLRYVEGGPDALPTGRFSGTGVVLGSGLLLAVAIGALGWLGGAFLTSAEFQLHPPLLGTVKVSSALAFDVGVYLVVVGLVLGVLRAVGGEHEEAA
jgi:multicomponent Na+:H+ antiporter subunit A